jgi:hypothetical protein
LKITVYKSFKEKDLSMKKQILMALTLTLFSVCKQHTTQNQFIAQLTPETQEGLFVPKLIPYTESRQDLKEFNRIVEHDDIEELKNFKPTTENFWIHNYEPAKGYIAQTPLLIACKHGAHQCIRYLLDNNTGNIKLTLNPALHPRWTPLVYAITYAHGTQVAIASDYGCLYDKEQRKYISEAFAKDLKVLLEKEVNELPRYLDIIEALKRHGAFLRPDDKKFLTALYHSKDRFGGLNQEAIQSLKELESIYHD